MITPEYGTIYANLLDKIRDKIKRLPGRSLDEIIAEYINTTGIKISASRVRSDILKMIIADSSCSKCGVHGELFKVGDEDFCEGCNDLSRDITVSPQSAQMVDMASSLMMSKFAVSVQDAMEVIEARLRVIASDYEGTSLEDNMDGLLQEFRRILSGSDRQIGDFRMKGPDLVPAVIERALRRFNLNKTFMSAVLTDSKIRKAIYDFIGAPEMEEYSSGGIDDLSMGDLSSRPDSNDGGLFNAITTTGL